MDLYAGHLDLPFRLGFWANALHQKSYNLTDLNEFTLNLQDCNLFIRPSPDNSELLSFTISYEYGNEYSATETSLTVIQEDVSNIECDVVMRVAPLTSLPQNFNVNFMRANRDFLLLMDEQMTNSTYLKFQNLTISGNQGVMTLNHHEIASALTINMDSSQLTLNQLKVADAGFDHSLNVNNGMIDLVLDNKLSAQTLNVTQPYGAICMAGISKSGVKESGCPTDQERAQEIVVKQGQPVVNKTCSVEATLCSSAGTCSGSSVNWRIELNDGPVQVRFAEITNESKLETISYLRQFLMFNAKGQQVLSDFNTLIEGSKEKEYLLDFGTISPSYFEKWAYITRKPYLEAKVWPLITASLGLLKPSISKEELVFVPATCPSLDIGNRVQLNGKLSDAMKKSLPVFGSSTVALIRSANTFTQFYLTTAGAYKEREVRFSSNVMMIVAFTLSFILAWFGAVVMFILLVKLNRLMNIEYQDFLASQRKLTRTRGAVSSKQNQINKKISISKAILEKLEVGLFKVHRTYKDEKELAEESRKQHMMNSLSKGSQVTRPLDSQLSYFQIPQLLVEWVRIRMSNSLKLYIENIPVSTDEFPLMRFENDSSKISRNSTNLFKFDTKYSEFCTKFGFNQLIVEEEKALLGYFNLQIDPRIDSTTRVYSNIRWKTVEEKRKIASTTDVKYQSTSENESSVAAFLTAECVHSKFSKDYILMYELGKRYEAFCAQNGFIGVKQEQLVGNPRLEEFGAVFADSVEVTYVNGVTHQRKLKAQTQTDNLQNDFHFKTGLVRRPRTQPPSGRWQKTKAKCRRCWNSFKYNFWSLRHPWANLIMVGVHLVWIAFLAFPLLILISWFIVASTVLEPSLTGKNFTIQDVLRPNSERRWWVQTGTEGIMLMVLLFTLAFTVIAVFSLISYYATSVQISGTLKVQKTRCKQIIDIVFWVFIIFISAIYISYVNGVLMWFVLGAILNPNEFLQYATAVITFYLFLVTKISYLNQIKDNLNQEISIFVDSQLQQLMRYTMNQLSLGDTSDADSLIADSFEKEAKLLFVKSLASFLGSSNQLTKERLDAIINGKQVRFQLSIEELVSFISISIGLHPKICKALIALVKQSPGEIVNSVRDLCVQIDVDPEIGSMLAELALNKYNPDALGINKVDGKVVLVVKQLFRNIFPQFPPEVIDSVFQLVSEGDPKPLIEVIRTQAGFPIETVDLINGFLRKNQIKVELAILKFMKRILPTDAIQVVEALFLLYRGRINKGIDIIAEILGFGKNSFLLILLIALQTKDCHLARVGICQTVELLGNRVNTSAQAKLRAKTSMLSIFGVARGYGVQTSLVYRKVRQHTKVSLSRLNSLNSILIGHNSSLAQICKYLNISQSEEIVSELFSLFKRRRGKMVEINKITAELGLERSLSDEVFSVVLLLKNIAVIDIFEQVWDYDEDLSYALFQNIWPEYEMRFYSKDIKNEVLQSIMSLVAGGTIDTLSLDSIEHLPPAIAKHLFRSHQGQNVLQTSLALSYLVFMRRPDKVIDLIRKSCLELSNGQWHVIQVLSRILFHFELSDIPIDPKHLLSYKHLESQTISALSEFIDVDRPITQLLLDMFSEDHFLTFGVKSPPVAEFGNKSRSFEITDTQRVYLLSRILGTSIVGVKEVAQNWLHQYSYIKLGKDSLGAVCKRIEMNQIFMDILLQSPLSLARTWQFDQFKYNETIKRFIKVTLKDKTYKHEALFLKHMPLQNIHPSVMQSPLVASNGQTQEQVEKMASFMITLCDIMASKRLTFLNLGFSYQYSLILQDMIRFLKTRDFHFLFKIIMLFINYGIQEQIIPNSLSQKNHYLELEEEEQSGIPPQDPRKSATSQRLLFLQMSLLVSAKKFVRAGKETDPLSRTQTMTSIKEILDVTNKYRRSMKREPFKIPKTFFNQSSNVFYGLFQLGYFEFFAEKIAEVVRAPDLATIFESMIGAVIGLATQNRSLLRVSLSALMKNSKSKVRQGLMDGLFGILTNDMNLDKKIRRFSTFIGLNSQVVFSLLQLKSTNSNDVTQAVDQLSKWGGMSDKASFFSNFIGLVRGDVHQLNKIVEDFGLGNPAVVGAMIGVAVKALDEVKVCLPQLCTVFEIQNWRTIQTVLRICHGDTREIQRLAVRKNTHFFIQNLEAAQAIIFLTNAGRNRANGRATSQDKQALSWAMHVITSQLEFSFGIKKSDKEAREEEDDIDLGNFEDQEEGVNEEDQDGFEEVTCLQSWQAGDAQIQLGDIRRPKSEKGTLIQDRSTQFNSEMNEKRVSFSHDLQLLVEASWGELQALSTLSSRIMENVERDIWNTELFTTQKEEMLRMMLQKTAKSLKLEQYNLQSRIEQKFKNLNDNITNLYELEENSKPKDPIDMLTSSEEINELISQGESYNEQLALSIGCTFNTTQFMPFQQRYYLCRTCNNSMNQHYALCLPCALFCHKGHDLVIGNAAKPIKIVCDCGNGQYASLKNNSLNSENKLAHLMDTKKACFFNIQAYRNLQDAYQEKVEFDENYAAPRLSFGLLQRLESNQVLFRDSESGTSLDLEDEEEKELSSFRGFGIIDGILNRKSSLISQQSSAIEKIMEQEGLDDQQRFQQGLKSYSVEEFITDLAHTLEMPSPSYRVKVPASEVLEIWDFQLKRKIHVVEQLIHLAMGNLLPSFLPLLTIKHPIDQFSMAQSSSFSKKSLEFRSVSALLALNQGNFYLLEQYGQGLANVLQITGAPIFAPLDKLKAIMVTAKGLPKPFVIEQYGLESHSYRGFSKLFGKVFGSAWEKGMALHTFLTLSRQEQLQALAAKVSKHEQHSEQGSGKFEEEEQIYSKALSNIVNRYLMDKLFRLEEKEAIWCKSLTRLSFQQDQAFVHISSDFVEPYFIDKYRAIVNPSLNKIRQLVGGFKTEFPLDLATSIVKLVKGDLDELSHFVTNVVIGRKVLNPRQTRQIKDIVRYVGNLASKQVFDYQDDIQNLCSILRTSKSFAKAIQGIGGLITRNLTLSFNLFRTKWFPKKDSIARSIVKLNLETWLKTDFKRILNLIQSNLYPQEQAQFYFKKSEMKLLVETVHALHGDLSALAKVGDHVLYQNKSALCSVFVSLMSSNTGYEPSDTDSKEVIQEKLHLKRKYITEFERLFLFTFRDFQVPAQVKELNIPYYIFGVISMDWELMHKVFDPVARFNPREFDRKAFVDLLHLINPRTGTPDFTQLLLQISKKVKLKYEISIPLFPQILDIPDEQEIQDKEIIAIQKALGFEQAYLKQLLGYEWNQETISTNVVGLLHLLFGILEMKSDSVKLLVALLIPLFNKTPALVRLFQALYFMVNGDKLQIFNLLGSIIKIILHIIGLQSELSKFISKIIQDRQLINGIVSWLKGLVSLLNKDRTFKLSELREMITSMLELLVQVMKNYQSEDKASALQNTLQKVSDTLIGVVNLCKGNIEGIEPLAKQLGGFEGKRIVELLQLLSRFKRFLIGEIVEELGGGNSAKIQKTLALGQKEWDLPKLFQMFDTDKSNTLDFTEFCQLSKYMGLFLNQEVLLKLFSEADQSGNNAIDYSEFATAVDILKRQISGNALSLLGLSTPDLVWVLVLSVFFLLLLFVFIFIGVSVFASTSSFGAVINAALPAFAGFSLSLRKDDQDKLMTSLSKAQINGLERVVQKIIKALSL